jgi:ParB family transcriptional regulator, chromosome partitioning protein
MKAADRISERLGAYIDESMGAARPAGAGDGAGEAFPTPGASVVHGGPDKYQGAARIKDALAIEVERIVPDPNQPRKDFDQDALAELAASLKARGQLQPIRVRWDEGLGKWIVIAGERRYRAALQAGLSTLACIEAKGPLTEDDTLEDQLVENCLREDLKPIEQAKAFKALLQRRRYSYRQLAESLHISHQAIVRALALLDLPEDIQGRVEAGELAPSVAYEVSRLEDSDQQREVAARVVEEELNRAEATEVVRRAAGKSAKPKGRGAGKARKVTFRTSPGPKITVEFRKGLDDELILAALADVMARINATRPAGDQAAA